MNTNPIWYIDTSVLLRAFLGDSEAASQWFNSVLESGQPLVSSTLLELEIQRVLINRALAKHANPNDNQPSNYLRSFNLAEMTPEIVRNASRLMVPLRAADAIHVATALDLNDGTITLVTHDRQMANAAKELGLPVFDPVTDDPNSSPVG